MREAIRLLVVFAVAQAVSAVVAAPPPGGAGESSSISLSPSVVMLKGSAGQSHRQTLRLTNHTTHTLDFELEAQDVVTDGGRRSFLAAGDRADSVAATAVFFPRRVTVPPGEAGTVDVTLTVPPETAVRAVAAIFRGRTVVEGEGGVGMTASLGALITFTLSDDLRLEASPVEVSPQSASVNLTLAQWVTNTGQEPAMAGGAVALLDESSSLVSRLPIEPQRLLPGERLKFEADCPTSLKPGSYRAVVSLEYERKLLTSVSDFTVASAPAGRVAARRDPGDRP